MASSAETRAIPFLGFLGLLLFEWLYAVVARIGGNDFTVVRVLLEVVFPLDVHLLRSEDPGVVHPIVISFLANQFDGLAATECAEIFIDLSVKELHYHFIHAFRELALLIKLSEHFLQRLAQSCDSIDVIFLGLLWPATSHSSTCCTLRCTTLARVRLNHGSYYLYIVR